MKEKIKSPCVGGEKGRKGRGGKKTLGCERSALKISQTSVKARRWKSEILSRISDFHRFSCLQMTHIHFPSMRSGSECASSFVPFPHFSCLFLPFPHFLCLRMTHILFPSMRSGSECASSFVPFCCGSERSHQHCQLHLPSSVSWSLHPQHDAPLFSGHQLLTPNIVSPRLSPWHITCQLFDPRRLITIQRLHSPALAYLPRVL